MGSFATTIFNLLLGWIRGLVSGFWELINSPQIQQGFIWLGENWFWLAAMIALAGLVIDYAIWLIRWRPYYVWGSWWRRLTRRDHREEKKEAPLRPYRPEFRQELQLEEVPAPEPSYEAYEDYGPQETWQQETRAWQEPYQEPYREPYQEPPQEPAAWQAPPQRRRRSRQREAAMPFARMRTGISHMAQRIDFMGLGLEDEEGEDYTYIPPPPAVDKRSAFHAPVYPTSKGGQEER